jgi:hypothetical protein
MEETQYQRNQLFTEEPRVSDFTKDQIHLLFTTKRESINGVVQYGPLLSMGNTASGMFRAYAKEKLPEGKTTTCNHDILMKMSWIEKPQYASGLIDNGGGTLVYRLENLDPKDTVMRYHEGRFSYRRRGEPGKGVYRRVPCIVEGPFIDLVTDQSAVISWKTDFPTAGKIKINQGRDQRIITINKPKRQHEVKIINLTADKNHTYTILPNKEAFPSRVFSFKTAPKPGSRKPFRFVYMSDGRNGSGSGLQNFNGVNFHRVQQLFEMGSVRQPAFFLFGGDLVDGYSDIADQFRSQLTTFKTCVQSIGARIPIYEAIGNHETCGDYFKLADPEDNTKHYLAFRDKKGKNSVESIFDESFVNPRGSAYGFSSPSGEIRQDLPLDHPNRQGPPYGESVYSFQWDNVHMVVLNSNYWTTAVKATSWASRPFADHLGSSNALQILGGNLEGYLMNKQLAWLDRDLKKAAADEKIDWIFVSMHEPAFPNGGHLADCMFWGTNRQGHLGGWNDRTQAGTDVIDMRDRFISILMKYPKVLALMTGDEHNYSRTLVNSKINANWSGSFWQFISGGAGAPHYMQDHSVPWKDNVKSFTAANHFCVFDINNKEVMVTVISNTGEIIEQKRHLQHRK